MKKLFYLGILFICIHAEAQQKNKSYLMPQLGVLDGDQSTSMQFQIVSGIVTKSWRIGMGTGIDYYKVRSVPIFADVRKYLGAAKKAFVFANVGYNVPWPMESQYKIFFVQGGNQKSQFEMGWYADAGIGYDIEIGKQKAISLSLSYSMKTFSEKYHEHFDWIWGWAMPQIPETLPERKIEYSFRRLSLKAGFRLW